MASEEKIFNKIIPIETIVEVANYLEDQKEEYKRLFEKDAEKNKDLKYSEQVYEYKGEHPKVQYTIKFKEGREITEPDYNWFIGMLGNLKAIEHITFFLQLTILLITRIENIMNICIYTHGCIFMKILQLSELTELIWRNKFIESIHI